MAGFFRQTAQRAQASGIRLHSSAALPYAAARDRSGESVSWTDDAQDGPVANAPRRAQAAVSVPAAAPPAASHDVAARPSLRESPRTAAVPESEGEPAPPTMIRSARTTHSIVERVISLAASESPRPSPALSTQEPAPRAGPVPLPATISPRPTAALRNDEPFKTQTRVQRDTVAKRAGGMVRRPQATAPEVHIHIGRVELTANAPAPAAPKRATANERRPLSLDDYLQQRRSRRPGTS